MRWFGIASAMSAALTAAAPIVENNLNYHSHAARAANLPTIQFPYGTWQASKYDAAGDLYIFRNIRFAAPPTGPLRFAKPEPPTPVSELQTGTTGGTCLQSMPKSMLNVVLGSSGSGLVGNSLNSLINSFDVGKLMSGGDATQEDCLFLDLYVPAKALKGDAKLPIINWIYGGAYILGSKGGPYAGEGILRAAQGNAIFVSGNYRLGALGFLAGTTMEKEGTPNAGFWDQRAVLEWIQKYASLFGGDANEVSVWGESAGGGSIMNQLVAFGGKKAPLFKRAVIESPAYDVSPDRRGKLENTYKALEEVAGCKDKGLACLRTLTFDQFKQAQAKYLASLPDGGFGFGPAVDGVLIRQSPVLELATGNFQKEVESLVVSHVSDEAAMFVQDNINNETAFRNLIAHNFGNFSKINDAIYAHYPEVAKSGGRYANNKARTNEYTQKSVFTCNTRWIAEAYMGKTYNVQYVGGHGTDIMATFYNSGSPTTNGVPALLGSLNSIISPSFPKIATGYQSYLTSHAITGDVNKLRKKDSTIEWPLAEAGPEFGNVMNITSDSFQLVKDSANNAKDCDFWRDVYAGLTSAGGYAVPGSVLESTLFDPAFGSPSRNYQT